MTNKAKYEHGLEIVVMAHDRQEETLRAVRALKAIDFGIPTRIVVSDNASNVDNVVVGLPPDVDHIIRTPCVSPNEHLMLIWKEFTFEWTLVTHDDDEMLPAFGEFFRQNREKSEVTVITGLSRIISQDGLEISDQGYENRLKKAGLFGNITQSTAELHNYLFDFGSLFPASAIIIRNGAIDFSTWNNNYALAADVAHSMKASLSGHVCFQGETPIMNYYLHGNNSVYSSSAAGGLMADFCITRFDFLTRYPEWASRERMKRLTKATLVARILAKSFHLDERYFNVAKYAREANRKSNNQAVNPIALIPLPLGILKPIVRFLMWRRLGVRRITL